MKPERCRRCFRDKAVLVNGICIECWNELHDPAAKRKRVQP